MARPATVLATGRGIAGTFLLFAALLDGAAGLFRGRGRLCASARFAGWMVTAGNANAATIARVIAAIRQRRGQVPNTVKFTLTNSAIR